MISAQIMPLKSLKVSRDHINGARYTVVAASDTLISARKLGDISNGETIYIPRITMQPSDSDLPFTLKIRQFPERPALAMTINKSHGQTFKKCGIILTTSVFTHGCSKYSWRC